MRQSELFTKTRREAPKGEVSKNAELLVRNNIAVIIREEMNAIGGQEVFLSGLQNPELWKKTGRWDDSVVDNWFKTKLSDGTELGLGHSHEEPLTALLTEHISSYRDLPKAIYQIQTKFRNELRAKSGLLRGREFLMKDMYSFVRTAQELDSFHEQVVQAYQSVFSRVGIGDRTFRTFASGGSFSKYSDEFQTLCDAGEDTVHFHRGKGIAVNKEVYTDEVLADLDIKKEELEEVKAIEVGNIFPLGTRFSEALGLKYKDE